MGCVNSSQGNGEASKTNQSLFDFKINDINGKLVDFSIFKDKKAILIVNVASK